MDLSNITLLGNSIGSWVQWIINLLVTVLTIIFTIRHFNVDHKKKIQLIQESGVYSTKNDGAIQIGKRGTTMYFLNTGRVPVSIAFKGIQAPYTFIARFVRYFCAKASFSQKANNIMRKTSHESFDERVMSIESLFRPFGEEYVTLQALEMNKPLIFEDDSYEKTIASMIKNDKKQKARLKKLKKIRWDVIISSLGDNQTRFKLTLGPEFRIDNPELYNYWIIYKQVFKEIPEKAYRKKHL